ncbi:UBX domain-containing protein 3 [Wickerhamiella sorbophila]|uniref:UBX domain-containing protein 3 n=1 Tax=Wickerhamiella sorbophila TaxID=45607 RepID=A0A2T0FHU8_9ASCO|nr:UBX domain-containing protein 3 [Wickerhamiella sorbophila]PRT54519.1 UBX domain-containing protein 3 [Wickerhamiella sorbophila]
MSVQDFVAATGAPIATAERYMSKNGGDLQGALAEYASQRRSRPAGGVTSLRDLQNRENSDDPNHLFTGGERSGLEVEGPGSRGRNRADGGPDIVGRIIDQARNMGPSLEDLSDDELGSHNSRHPFTSTAGFRLGTPDTTGGPVTSAVQEPEATPQRVKRTIYFWQDGFSVDDGDLYRYDDPTNVRYLESINSGQAPLEVLGVVSNQYVDVRVEQRMNEPYVQPKRKPTFESSEGQRLGTMGPSSTQASMPPQAESGSSAAVEDGPGGDTLIQVRLANGQQHRAHFDGQGTIQQLYDYADALNGDRAFVMSTMFPMRALDDRSETLEKAGLKNSVVVQRYT